MNLSLAGGRGLFISGTIEGTESIAAIEQLKNKRLIGIRHNSKDEMLDLPGIDYSNMPFFNKG